MKRAIITGGTGFVGSAVIQELLAHQVEVWAVVRPDFHQRMDTSRLKDLPVHYVECNFREIATLPGKLTERGFDVWYQFAWDGLRGEALTDYTTQLNNTKWTLDAVVAAAEIGCKKFVGSGSVSQYELEVKHGQIDMHDKHRVYKTAKLACQYMGNSVAQANNIEFIWPIITNIYGVGESSPRLINSMIRNLQTGKHQSLSEGEQIYDFIYITDAAKAFRLIGEKGRSGRIYTIAQGRAQPLKYFLTTLRDIVAPCAELGFGELEFNGIYLPAEAYNIDQLRSDTDFVPDISFEEGIRRTAEWIMETV